MSRNLVVPAPWRLKGEPVSDDATMRFRLTWERPPEKGEKERVAGVVMLNPSWEGTLDPAGMGILRQLGMTRADQKRPLDPIRDGATHRRVRKLLGDFTEIRVVNLSPWRSSKPHEAKRTERVMEINAELQNPQRQAMQWVTEADVVVAAWGGEKRTPFMEESKGMLLRALGEKELFCWGVTDGGEPLHPSPLGRVGKDAALVPFGLTRGMP